MKLPKYKIKWTLIYYEEEFRWGSNFWGPNDPAIPTYKYIINDIIEDKYYYTILDYNTSTFIDHGSHYITSVDANENIKPDKVSIFKQEIEDIINE